MPAGPAVQTTTGLGHLPHRTVAGIGVLALWAAGAVVIGATVLRLRDA
ncbi:hypothetical protein ABZ281_32635 [Streptomyces sp. NPDC006265]